MSKKSNNYPKHQKDKTEGAPEHLDVLGGWLKSQIARLDVLGVYPLGKLPGR